MASRLAARRGARGGDGIQAFRPTRTRLATAAAALAVTGALAVYPPLLAGRGAALVAVPGALAAAAVLVALLARSETAAFVAVALFGGAYTGALFLRGSQLDARVPLYAALLVLLPELVAWSAQSTTRIQAEPGVWLVRLGALAAIVLASLAATGAILSVTVVGIAGGLAWEAAGVAAAVGAFALLASLGRGS